MFVFTTYKNVYYMSLLSLSVNRIWDNKKSDKQEVSETQLIPFSSTCHKISMSSVDFTRCNNSSGILGCRDFYSKVVDESGT